MEPRPNSRDRRLKRRADLRRAAQLLMLRFPDVFNSLINPRGGEYRDRQTWEHLLAECGYLPYTAHRAHQLMNACRGLDAGCRNQQRYGTS